MGKFPEAFHKRMAHQIGDQWLAFEQSHNEPSPVSIRINALKTEAISEQKVKWCDTGYYLDERPSFTLDPKFHAGGYYVQEASSMFLEQALKQATTLSDSLNILDLCAAPGGKSTHILSLMNDQSLLVSNEVIRSRANILSENIQKWGRSNVVVTSNDPQDFGRLDGFFDVLVLDAPCSGEGLFRKDPAAMEAWSPDNINLCSKRQRRILQDVWPSLKQGALIIYSTCTYNEFENEDNLDWLSSQHDIAFMQLEIPDDWQIEKVQKNSVVGYRLYPHRVRGEGFFISLFRKQERTHDIALRKSNALTSPAKKNIEVLSSWLKDPAASNFFQHHDDLRIFPARKMKELSYLSQKLYIHNAGTSLATAKHDKLVPEHSAALSVALQKEEFQVVDVTREQALQFLRKETMSLSYEKLGFALIQFEGNSIGWVNLLQNRVNNLYPADWRIRM